MIYELLKRNILDENPYKSKTMLKLLALNFKANGSISEEEYNELYLLLNPAVEEGDVNE